MRAATITILGAALSASVARAEPGTVEAAAREISVFEPVRPGELHGRVYAQLGAVDDEAAAALGAEASYQGSRCDYARAGGQVRLGVNDDARLTAEQWASVCIPVITMEFGHHLEWDVRPSLLAPLGLRPGRNRRETLRFHWQPLRGPLPKVLAAIERGEAAKQGLPPPPERTPAQEARLPQGELVIFEVDVAHTILWDASSAAPAVHLEQVEAYPFRYVNDRFTVDVFQGGGEFHDGGATVHAWLLKLERLGLGPLELTGGLGIASAGAGELVDDVSREVDVTEPRLVAGVAYRRGGLAAELRAARDVALVPDGYVTVESRVDASLAWEGVATRLALSATRARTDVHVPGAPVVAGALTGGGALALARRLSPHLSASARVEVARSFYAADVLALERAPRWGATAFAVLEAALSR